MTTTSEPAARPTRRRARQILAATLAATGLLVLAACMKVDMSFTLSEDDTVSGSVVMALSDEFAESIGMEPQELWDSMNEGGDGPTSELPEGATEEPYAEDGYTGVRMTYDDQPIATLGATDEELSITREGDEYVVAGVMDLSDAAADLESGEVPEGFAESFLMTIAVTFPGEVSETNGAVDGTTVTWEPAFGERTEIDARGSAVGDGTAPDDGASEDDGAGGPSAEADGGATDGDGDGAAADDGASTDDDMTTTAAETDGGFPWWIVAVVVALGVVGVIVALVVRNNRRPGPPTSSNPHDVFGAQPGDQRPGWAPPGSQGPPTIPPGQGPVDPPGPPGPSQGPQDRQ